MEHRQLIGYEIHTLDNMIGRFVTLLSEKDGLTQMQSWIIGYLYDHSSEEVFQKDLEAQFHIARSTASGILQTMEKRGYIRRESVASDARLKRLTLTERGIGHQISVIKNLTKLENMLKKDISEDDLTLFFQTIDQMKRNIKNHSL